MGIGDWVGAASALALGWAALAALGWWRAGAPWRARRARRTLLWAYLALSGLAGTWGVASSLEVALVYRSATPNFASLLSGFVLGAVFWPLLAFQGLWFWLEGTAS